METREVNEKLNEARNAALKRIEALEEKLALRDAELAAGGMPPENVVTFIGGPYDMTRRALTDEELNRGEYKVAVAAPMSAYDGYGISESRVRIGAYSLRVLGTYFNHRPVRVGLWDGVR